MPGYFSWKEKVWFFQIWRFGKTDCSFLLWTAEQQLGYNITSTKNLSLACTSARTRWCMPTHFYPLPTISHPSPTHASKHPPRLLRTRATSKRSSSTSLYSNPWKDTAEFHVECTHHSFYWMRNWHHTGISEDGISEPQANLVIQSAALHCLITTNKELNLRLEAVTTLNKLKGPHSH